MNQNILQKAITELKSDKPKIDYVLGMLETLYEMGIGPIKDGWARTDIHGNNTIVPSVPITDEAGILDAKARAAIEQVKAMSEASKE